jgi:hypothetical protein
MARSTFSSGSLLQNEYSTTLFAVSEAVFSESFTSAQNVNESPANSTVL